MKAAHVTEWCAEGTVPTTIQFGEVPEPPPPVKNELLIEVKASALNIDDIANLQDTLAGGWFFHGRKPSVEAPLIGGMEYAGVVLACGPDCTQFKVGDRVCGLQDFAMKQCPGTWAEKTIAPESDVVSIPTDVDLSYVEAAAICMGAMVSGDMYRQAALPSILTNGSEPRCLVIGASGGLGTIMVELLTKHKETKSRPHITAVCSGRNADMVRNLGADETIDYNKGPFQDQLRAAGVDKFDVIFDFVGGVEVQRGAEPLLSNGGKFITSVGPHHGLGDHTITFSEWVSWVGGFTVNMLRSYLPFAQYKYILTFGMPPLKYEDVHYLVVEVGIRGSVTKEIPFAEAPLRNALAAVAERRPGGKIVINMEKTSE